MKAERLLYQLPKWYCPRCRRTFRPRAPAVLPKRLYGNQLLATATTMHYLYGISLGKVCDQMGLGAGGVVEVFHRVAHMFAGIPDRLIQEYRQAPVKHADDRWVPAENNLAERDLRPTVIARKVGFGCQSDAGAHTSGVLMSVLDILKKRQVDVGAQPKAVLYLLAVDIQQDPFPFLLREAPT